MAGGQTRWTFYGTGEHRPAVGQFLRQLDELGYSVSCRLRQVVDGQLLGYVQVDPMRTLHEVSLTLTLAGKAGELTLSTVIPGVEEIKALRKLRFGRKPSADRLSLVGMIHARDEGPGRAYRDLIRPILCLLGELFPEGVAQRHGDLAVFQTRRMRRRLSSVEVEQYHFEGFLSFPVELVEVIEGMLEADPLWLKLGYLLDRKLQFYAAPVVFDDAGREGCIRELELLARHAQAGCVTITGPGSFNASIELPRNL